MTDIGSAMMAAYRADVDRDLIRWFVCYRSRRYGYLVVLDPRGEAQ